jgi:hypothetical protein
MPATAKGIYHNLRESKYAVSNSEIAFYFSSEFYLSKFLGEYQENREKYQKRMKNLLIHSPYNMDIIADITLYQQIEKRGFFVRLKRAKITKDDLYKYALRKMTEKESLGWVKVNGKAAATNKNF